MKKGQIFGSFKLVKKFGLGVYGMQCTTCGYRERMNKSQLKEQCPKCNDASDIADSLADLAKSVEDLKKAQKKPEGLTEDKLSLYQQASQDIFDRLEEMEDPEGFLAHKANLLRTYVDMLPIAEEKYRESGSSADIYAFNAIVDKMQDLMESIEEEQVQKDLAQVLIMEVLNPTFSNIGRAVVEKILMAKVTIKQEPKKAELILETVTREICKVIEEEYRLMQTKMHDQLDVE